MDSFILYNDESDPLNELEVLPIELNKLQMESLVFKSRKSLRTMKQWIPKRKQKELKNQISQLNRFLKLLIPIMNMKFFGT